MVHTNLIKMVDCVYDYFVDPYKVVDYLEEIAINVVASFKDATHVVALFTLMEASFHSYSSVNGSYL